MREHVPPPFIAAARKFNALDFREWTRVPYSCGLRHEHPNLVQEDARVAGEAVAAAARVAADIEAELREAVAALQAAERQHVAELEAERQEQLRRFRSVRPTACPSVRLSTHPCIRLPVVIGVSGRCGTTASRLDSGMRRGSGSRSVRLYRHGICLAGKAPLSF
jgi:hypothetical protein